MPEREFTNSFLYGKGIFTTVSITNGKAFVWDKHWSRLTGDAAKIGLNLDQYSEEVVRAKVDQAIASSTIPDSRVRITFFDESPSEIWSANGEPKTTLSIIVGEKRPVPETFRLTVSSFCVNSRSPLGGVKSCNYLEPILAIEEAQKRGFNEAIRVNERGQVTGGCVANVFWLKDGQLFTPSLSTGCLPGTTREFVLENLVCAEIEAEMEQLEKASAIFLTSAGLGIVAAAEIDSRALASAAHPITALLPGTR